MDFETARKYWNLNLKELVLQISATVTPPLQDSQWSHEKNKTRVCTPDETGKKKRCAGELYLCGVLLQNEDAAAIWKLFVQFAKTQGLAKIERLKNNEKDLGRYDFRAENLDAGDRVTCSIYLPGEWNRRPGLSLSVFVGPRFRKIDLADETAAHPLP